MTLNVLDNFDDWARLSARLRGQSPNEVRATCIQLGVSSQWAQADAHWSEILIEEIANGDLDRAYRYSQICSQIEDHRASELASSTPAKNAAGVEPSPIVPEPPAAPAQSETMASDGGIPPSAPHDDFRHQALYRAHKPSGNHGTVPLVHDNFRAQMAPNIATLEEPIPGQKCTLALDSEGAMESDSLAATIHAAQQAAQWPLKKYAEMCAASELEGEQNAAQRYGLPNRETYEYARRLWQRRFESDPALRDQFDMLIAALRKQT